MSTKTEADAWRARNEVKWGSKTQAAWQKGSYQTLVHQVRRHTAARWRPLQMPPVRFDGRLQRHTLRIRCISHSGKRPTAQHKFIKHTQTRTLKSSELVRWFDFAETHLLAGEGRLDTESSGNTSCARVPWRWTPLSADCSSSCCIMYLKNKLHWRHRQKRC